MHAIHYNKSLSLKLLPQRKQRRFAYAALLKNHDVTIPKIFRQAFKIQIYCCNDTHEEAPK